MCLLLFYLYMNIQKGIVTDNINSIATIPNYQKYKYIQNAKDCKLKMNESAPWIH